MKQFIDTLKRKKIHVVGFTGAEGSNIVRFLRKHGVSDITLHDFLREGLLEKSFKYWHKNIAIREKEILYRQFLKDINDLPLKIDENYLDGIEDADFIFVPQSWRLYPQNKPLINVHSAGVPFYSITRLYFDYSPATVVAVTGTVGKGSTSNILYHLLIRSGKKVYFAGNETWRLQLADRLDEMHPDDILLLEVSHRQLIDGFTKPPHITVFTNLYPNHLDEMSWEEYKRTKLTLLTRQKSTDYAVINYDSEELNKIGMQLKSKVIYYSANQRQMNSNTIQKIYPEIIRNAGNHFPVNMIAAATAAEVLGVEDKQILTALSDIPGLSARMEYLGEKSGIRFFDDIKSTTPWSTLAALRKLQPSKTLLICGGRTKSIPYSEFSESVMRMNVQLVIVRSELSENLEKYLRLDRYIVTADLDQALKEAFKSAQKGDSVLLSPAAAFFYSDFVKGKQSFRKLFTSLLPKEQV